MPQGARIRQSFLEFIVFSAGGAPRESSTGKRTSATAAENLWTLGGVAKAGTGNYVGKTGRNSS
jgi:hypothetical protein